MKLQRESMDRLVTLHQKNVEVEGMEPVFLKTQAGGLTRNEKWNGRTWFVVQTVAVISKVLNGELLPVNEVALFAESWNGRPVPLRHPQVNGFYVSANSPKVIEDFNLGYFFNARAESHDLGARLVGEMWLDVALIEAKGGVAMNALKTLQAGGTVEVSTAYFCLVRDEHGVFNGEEYTGVQYNVKPDHVALLPDEVGACSVKDGCGVNTNAAEGVEETVATNFLQPDQSVMVGIFLEPESAAVLRMEDQDAPNFEATPDLHVTLAYLGMGDQVVLDQMSLSELVDYVSRQLYAHTVGITGTFRFYNADQGRDAVGYLVDGETLARVRDTLVEELSYSGQEVSRAGNWVPHMTLGYTSDSGLVIPSPGVDRFGVQAISLAYGSEVIRFPLRGELGQAYVSMNRRMEDMANEEQKTPCGQVPSVNSDVTGETPITPAPNPEPVQESPVIPAELKDFMDQVTAAGGVKAIMDALATVTAANGAKRNGAVERIKALTSVYGDDALDGMTTDALVTLADALASVQPVQNGAAQKFTNYAAAAGGATVPATNTIHVAGLGELRPFKLED